MKKTIIVSTLFALASVSALAQGLINFNNNSITQVTTNTVAGGAATGGIAGKQNWHFALYCSTTATTVNGQSSALNGTASTNYVFNDTNWTLVAYGTNSGPAGQFTTANPNTSGSGTTVVAGVAGGSTARFVMIGWSAIAGTNIAALQSWFNEGNPAVNGWIGQSAVSGSLTLGTTVGTALFGTNTPYIPGFTLGFALSSGPVAPVITSQPINKTAATGGNANFSVGAYGSPSLAYQWMFNTNTIIAGATNASLTIFDVQSNNAGTYSVVITNTAGLTNSFAATLTVTGPGIGYVNFENLNGVSATKIYTNSSVGGAAMGLTAAPAGLYYYALYASSNATDVDGQTTPILGSASSNYAFNDSNWTLVAYGTNASRGMIICGPVSVPGSTAGTKAQFVVIGWSANVATTDIGAVEAWFNGGSPAANGWIGQSAVSGAIELGNNGSIFTQPVFGTNAPYLSGFTLGLASPTPGAAYVVPTAPPAMMQTIADGNAIRLSWLTASGSWGVQTASSPAGPWSDTGWTISSDGSNSWVDVTNAVPNQFYRLVAQ